MGLNPSAVSVAAYHPKHPPTALPRGPAPPRRGMGVPAFFKWLSVKYPKIVVDCIEDKAAWTDDGEQIPVDSSKANPNGLEYDNLFLDMNGIIHPASHPEDRPPPETEDDMFLAIVAYLERVFAAVRPRKLLYMAIDGVAPRAKMNQQRARRFKSAQEAAEKEEEEERMRAEWAAEGRSVPPRKEGQAFDSNTITPGTPFMDNLALFLRAFISKKLSTDPGWQGIHVILSDGSVPGEGEHKIMEYIRSQRLQVTLTLTLTLTPSA
jgi:5'-3' exoribonuclease 2